MLVVRKSKGHLRLMSNVNLRWVKGRNTEMVAKMAGTIRANETMEKRRSRQTPAKRQRSHGLAWVGDGGSSISNEELGGEIKKYCNIQEVKRGRA